MISRDQIRAARALLDWTQPTLAEKAEVSTDLISKIESGVTNGSLKTLSKIQSVFELAGVEFLDHDGVRRQNAGVREYRGQEGFIEFIKDVYETVKNGGDIFVSNVDETDFIKWEGDEADAHMARMANIEGLEMRILVKKGDHFHPADYAVYRSVPERHFGSLPYYIYGNKIAFIAFSEKSVDVYVINHVDISEFFKQEFVKLWHDSA